MRRGHKWDQCFKGFPDTCDCCLYLLWPQWGSLYLRFLAPLQMHQSPRCSIHSRAEREKERPQEPLYSLTCATSFSPCFLWAPAFAETCREPAPCSTYNHNLCIMHPLHSKRPLWMHTRTHTHIRLLHPPELRYGVIRRHASKFTTSSTVQRKAAPHRSERRRFYYTEHRRVSAHIDVVCLKLWCLYFLFIFPSHQSFWLTHLTLK